MNSYNIPQGWRAILSYSIILYAMIESLDQISVYLFGSGGRIHIEILLPAFVLGMVIRADHNAIPDLKFKKVSNSISYLFMLLVGMSMPLFIGLDFDTIAGDISSVISGIPMPSWGAIALHVVLITLVSNIGKLFPLFFYKDRKIGERLAVSIGMFTRGEVGAGVLFIAIGYQLGGVLLIVSVLAMCLNLLLTGFFISYAKRLTINNSKTH